MKKKGYVAVLKSVGRVMKDTSPRLLFKFSYLFMWKSAWNLHRFTKRQKAGKPFFPAFLMISVTEACNLSCSGCWVSEGGRKSLTVKQLDGIIQSSKGKGSYFFGILGGEPLLHQGLLEVLKKHADCYFQLFTNGTLITEKLAFQLKKLGNVTPLISIEGLEQESDRRRGKDQVFSKSVEGLRACKKAGLIVGVAASICKSNYEELVSPQYIKRLLQEGVHYVWYYIYRPVGSKPEVENALNQEQILGLRRFLVEQRTQAPILIVDAYWDENGQALCAGATGMSHHIAPSGALEFCPPIQMAADFINEDGSNVVQLFEQSTFLEAFRLHVADRTRGCIIMDDPEDMTAFLSQQKVTDATSRQSVMHEYACMKPCPSHDMGSQAIPETNPLYRMLKKKYFFGFGAYG
jgi:MoaA/NifB/PqqE/SkfB family radical SAM enzyme